MTQQLTDPVERTLSTLVEGVADASEFRSDAARKHFVRELANLCGGRAETMSPSLIRWHLDHDFKFMTAAKSEPITGVQGPIPTLDDIKPGMKPSEMRRVLDHLKLIDEDRMAMARSSS